MRHFTSKKLNHRGFAFWKNQNFEPTNQNLRNFYDGLYIDFTDQNMDLNEKIFTGSEREKLL